MSALYGYLAQELSMWSNARISAIAVDGREGLFNFLFGPKLQRIYAVKCKGYDQVTVPMGVEGRRRDRPEREARSHDRWDENECMRPKHRDHALDD